MSAAALTHPGLTRKLSLTFDILADLTKRYGFCDAGLEWLGPRLGIAERSASYRISQLVKAGLIRRVRVGNDWRIYLAKRRRAAPSKVACALREDCAPVDRTVYRDLRSDTPIGKTQQQTPPPTEPSSPGPAAAPAVVVDVEEAERKERNGAEVSKAGLVLKDSFESAPPPAESQTVALLVTEAGLGEREARAVAAAQPWSMAQIRQAVAAYRAAKGVRAPVGWFLRALERGYQPPGTLEAPQRATWREIGASPAAAEERERAAARRHEEARRRDRETFAARTAQGRHCPAVAAALARKNSR